MHQMKQHHHVVHTDRSKINYRHRSCGIFDSKTKYTQNQWDYTYKCGFQSEVYAIGRCTQFNIRHKVYSNKTILTDSQLSSYTLFYQFYIDYSLGHGVKWAK